MQVAYKRKIPEQLGKKLKAVVTVSIPYDQNLFTKSSQHGEVFLQTMKLIASDEKIDSVEIVIADTLQIHNLKAIYKTDTQTAENTAKKLGKYWYNENIVGNQQFFENFSKKIVIKHWDDYKEHVDFQTLYAKVNNLYQTEKPNGFYQKTRSQAGVFVNKVMARIEQATEKNSCSRNEILEGSIELLKEEAAIRAILGASFDVEYYPEELDSVMEASCEKLSDGKPYRVVLVVRKEREKPLKNELPRVSKLGFYGNGKNQADSFSEPKYGYPDAVFSHPLINAIVSSTMLAINLDNDPAEHIGFLARYNQFLAEYLVEANKQKKSPNLPNKLSSLALLTTTNDEKATILSLDDEIIGTNNNEQQETRKPNKFQLRT